LAFKLRNLSHKFNSVPYFLLCVLYVHILHRNLNISEIYSGIWHGDGKRLTVTEIDNAVCELIYDFLMCFQNSIISFKFWYTKSISISYYKVPFPCNYLGTARNSGRVWSSLWPSSLMLSKKHKGW
jgi:hypothetical protein